MDPVIKYRYDEYLRDGIGNIRHAVDGFINNGADLPEVDAIRRLINVIELLADTVDLQLRDDVDYDAEPTPTPIEFPKTDWSDAKPF